MLFLLICQQFSTQGKGNTANYLTNPGHGLSLYLSLSYQEKDEKTELRVFSHSTILTFVPNAVRSCRHTCRTFSFIFYRYFLNFIPVSLSIILLQPMKHLGHNLSLEQMGRAHFLQHDVGAEWRRRKLVNLSFLASLAV